MISLSILIANGLISYQGFKDSAFFSKYSFKVDQILIFKDYKRLISSGFLHANWQHLIFNMITLYFFSDGLEMLVGNTSFLVIYFGSLMGGNLFSLYIHRNHMDYSAIGASGAVSGLVFASIALFPDIEIGFFLLPFYIPGWLYGIGYVLFSIYGIKSQNDNIGHEAHLGGGIIGLLIAVIANPSALSTNTFPIIIILLPSLIFLYIVINKPYLLMISNPFSKSKGVQTFEDIHNTKRNDKQVEIDKILDKISKKGYENLSKRDREKLNDLTK